MKFRILPSIAFYDIYVPIQSIWSIFHGATIASLTHSLPYSILSDLLVHHILLKCMGYAKTHNPFQCKVVLRVSSSLMKLGWVVMVPWYATSLQQVGYSKFIIFHNCFSIIHYYGGVIQGGIQEIFWDKCILLLFLSNLCNFWGQKIVTIWLMDVFW